jgi:hypothetical protein
MTYSIREFSRFLHVEAIVLNLRTPKKAKGDLMIEELHDERVHIVGSLIGSGLVGVDRCKGVVMAWDPGPNKTVSILLLREGVDGAYNRIGIAHYYRYVELQLLSELPRKRLRLC